MENEFLNDITIKALIDYIIAMNNLVVIIDEDLKDFDKALKAISHNHKDKNFLEFKTAFGEAEKLMQEVVPRLRRNVDFCNLELMPIVDKYVKENQSS